MGAQFSRRHFFRSAGAGAAALTGLSLTRSTDARELATSEPHVTQLGEHLSVYHGPINVGIVRDGARCLLVDCGDASVADRLPELEITAVDRVLFTHHHRDQACGADRLVARGAKLLVPAAERDHFDKVADYWNSPASRWDIYKFHPHHLMLAEPVPVEAVLAPGDTIAWGPAKITAIFTPGHTDGSQSYLVEVDGKRVVFSGDAIYDQGRIWDLHSLQKGFQRDKRRIGDYHGFLGAQWELRDGLGRIKEAQPDALVPSHGRIMAEPAAAIDALFGRLDTCYDRYVAISALRHYFPEIFAEFAGRKDHMPIRPGKTPPDCLRHVGTTWVLVSRDKAALVMDCGSPRVVPEIQKWIAQGDIRSVEGLWVTHYHNDHTANIPEFQATFDCPCITDQHVAQVIGDPMAWRLPCISPSKARVDRPTRHGESWTWHEFKLTAYHLPGQTLYHSGLLVEGDGLRMLFVGDSFTAAGIDDYCAQNRDWLGPGVGFDRCLALIDKLKPTHLFNCHVADAFDFTPGQIRFMRANLAEREKLFGELFPWDHANYGMDESWVRCDPYEQEAKPGATVTIRVVVTNHSTEPREAACLPVLPRAWGKEPGQIDELRPVHVTIGAKTDGEVSLTFRVPPAVKHGRYVVPVDVRYDRWTLPQFTEAIVVVS